MASFAELFGLSPIEGSLFPVSEEAQKQAQGMGILQSGLGILANSRGKSLGQALGAGGMMGLQGYNTQMQTAQQNQMMQAMRAAQMAKAKREQDQAGALDAYIASLPPEQQALAKADPVGFAKRSAEVMLRPPKDPQLVTVPVDGQPGVTRQMWVTPGATDGQYLGGPKLPEILNPDVQAARQAIAARGAPNVTNRISVDTGKSLAGKVGDIADNALNSATSAAQQMANNNRVLEALDSGKVMAGPGTTLRTAALQVGSMLGVGGKDATEALVNTRKVVQGLAESTLASRGMLKGQGQVTEYEQKTLEKARSGNIDDMTIPELRAIFQVANRLAQEQYSRSSSSLQEIQTNPEYRQIAPFYRAPELPQPYQAPAPAAPTASPARVRRFNPVTGKIE